MSERIFIDKGEVSNYSNNISSSSSNIEIQSLSSIDSESTIVGNLECQKAFEESQNMLSSLVSALKQEADKIRQLGEEFSCVDESLANMVKMISK